MDTSCVGKACGAPCASCLRSYDYRSNSSRISAERPIIREPPDCDRITRRTPAGTAGATGGMRMTIANELNGGRVARGRVVPSDVKKAVAYMRQRTAAKLSVIDLASHCGVAERTLHKHFRAFLGASPLDYWRRLRLAEAREELLRCEHSTSVTDIAARFGFSHFGRFAQQYRRQFGETPSSTLRWAHLAQHGVSGARRSKPGSSVLKTAIGQTRERPSLGILPCEVATLAPQHHFFAEFLAQGIAAALCRVRSLSILVAKHPHVSRGLDPRRLARDLGTRYLLTG